MFNMDLRKLFLVTPTCETYNAESVTTDPEDVIEETVKITSQTGKAQTESGKKRKGALAERTFKSEKPVGMAKNSEKITRVEGKRWEYPGVRGLQFQVIDQDTGDEQIEQLYLVTDSNIPRVRHFADDPRVKELTFEEAEAFMATAAKNSGRPPLNLEDFILPYELSPMRFQGDDDE